MICGDCGIETLFDPCGNCMVLRGIKFNVEKIALSRKINTLQFKTHYVSVRGVGEYLNKQSALGWTITHIEAMQYKEYNEATELYYSIIMQKPRGAE